MTARSVIGATAALLVLTGACSGPQVEPGYDTPESVVYDAAADVYLVSNIVGAPTAKDGDGYIARVRPDLATMDRYWIRGGRDGVELHAPKGMAIAGDVLWVTDIDVLRRFDRRTGAPLGSIPVPGATFLNDCAAAPDGTVYCTDTGLDAAFGPSGTDAIWRVGPDLVPAALARGTDLGQPNGIVARATGVFVVGWLDGSFYQIDRDGRRTDLGTAPTGQLDGLVRTDGPVWYLTSWAGSCVYRFTPTDGFQALPTRLEQPADAGWDSKRGLLLVPLFGAHAIERLGAAPR